MKYLLTIVMTFFILHFKIRENSLKFAKNSLKFANFKVQNEECHHYATNLLSNLPIKKIMTYQHDKILTSYKPHTYYLLHNPIFTNNCHTFSKIFINPPNCITHF
jgi:hypothetical protein